MLLFIALFGLLSICLGFYVAQDDRRARNDKLAKIQRELARREKANAAQEDSDS